MPFNNAASRGKFRRKLGTGLVLSALGLWTTAQSAMAVVPVRLYDDFSSAALSNTLWTKDIAGAGTIAFNGGQAVLDMSSATVGKAARLVFPRTLTMQSIGPEFRVTWDQQFTSDNLNAFGSGFAIVSGSATLIEGQQVGRQNDGVFANPFLPHHFMVYGGTGVGTYGTFDGGTLKHHFDLSFTASTITMSVYAYNSNFDATPDSYLSSGTLLETLSETTPSFSSTAPLTVEFCNELALGTDGYTQTRGVVAFDNIFMSVPEPASLSMLAGGSAMLVFVRRRRRN